MYDPQFTGKIPKKYKELGWRQPARVSKELFGVKLYGAGVDADDAVQQLHRKMNHQIANNIAAITVDVEAKALGYDGSSEAVLSLSIENPTTDENHRQLVPELSMAPSELSTVLQSNNIDLTLDAATRYLETRVDSIDEHFKELATVDELLSHSS